MADQEEGARFLRGPLCRLSYPALTAPRAAQPVPGEEPKAPQYGATLIFDERSKGTGNGGGLVPVNATREAQKWASLMPALVQSVGLMAREHWPKEFKAEGAPWFADQAWKSPWIDGGKPKWADKGGLGAGTIFIRPSSNRIIPCADRTGKAATDLSIFYPGCYVYPVLTTFFYTPRPNKPNYGISFGLRGLQFVEDGERLDDAVNLADYFEALEGDEMPAGDTEAALAGMFKV